MRRLPQSGLRSGLARPSAWALLVVFVAVGASLLWQGPPHWVEVLAGGALVLLAVVLGAAWRQLLRQRDDLASGRRQHQRVLEGLPVMVYVDRPDAHSSNLYTSPASTAICGYTPQEWAADPTLFASIIHPDDAERVRAAHRAFYQEGGTLSLTYRVRHKDGHDVWVHDEAALVRDQQGQPLHVQGCWQDVTHSQELEEQLRQSQKMEAIGKLAGGVAHDFNNLLQAISGYAELALLEAEEVGPETLLENVQEIKAATERAAGLTRQLLAYSRQSPQCIEPLDLGQVVRGVEDMLRTLSGEPIRLEILIAPALPLVAADRHQIEQVLVNLVVNARDAMPQGGRVTVTVRPEIDEQGEWVVLSVADEGHGIDPEQKERIFDPFFTTKAVGAGTGLGLSTVVGVVEQTGGRVEVESAWGQGSEFSVRLPMVALPVTPPLAPADAHPAALVPAGA